MRILYYDCFSGISGDMNLGAMIDLGVDMNYLIEELSKLKVSGYEIKVKKSSKMDISGTRVDIDMIEHHHDNHIHRTMKDIQQIIGNSSLNENVKRISLNIFMIIAKAEGKVHDKPVEKVHFHEVGGIDSIVDVVGAAICIDYLKVDRVMASTIELGGGFVRCAHGVTPVPAPAVVEIMKGIPVKSGAVNFETTTPTGAGILAAVVDEFTDNKNFIINKIGYGIGHRDMDIPNVLRMFLGEVNEQLHEEKAWILECNIDDMNPEIYDYIMEKLFKKGASDVYFTPIIMKKNRPAIKLSVLCCKSLVSELEGILLKETTTLGIRKYEVKKTMLKRKIIKINTKYGYIDIKEAYYEGMKIKWKAEYEHCRKISEKYGVPISEVYKLVETKICQLDN